MRRNPTARASVRGEIFGGGAQPPMRTTVRPRAPPPSVSESTPSTSSRVTSRTRRSSERGRQLAGEAPPQRPARADLHVRRVHAAQADPAEDEGEDGRVQRDAPDLAARRDRRADPGRAQRVGERRAADRVDDAGPALALERPGALRRGLLAGEHLGRAELAQQVGLVRLARARVDLVAEPGQHVDGERADAAGRAEHEHRAVAGLQPRVLQVGDRQGGGEPGRPQRHRVARREPLGQRHDPPGRHPRELRVATVVRDADVVGVREHRVARPRARDLALHDLAREVDPRDERGDPRDLARRRDGERVLVVHARPADADRHVALGEVARAELAQLAAHLVALALGHERPVCHVRHPPVSPL